MTVDTSLTKVQYEGNGLARLWAVPFPVRAEEHLKLVFTGANGVESPVVAGFEVIGIGSASVQVKYPVSGSPLASGERLTIYRYVPLTQDTDLENGTAFNAEVIERQFDISCMQVQQLQEQLDRAITVPPGSEVTPHGLMDQLFTASQEAKEAALSAEEDAQEVANDLAIVSEKTNAAQQSADSAKHWAEVAEQFGTQGVPDATEEVKGKARFGTEAEHIAAASGVAAQPKHIAKMVSDGIAQVIPTPTTDDKGKVLAVGDDLKYGLSDASGVSLFDIKPSLTGVPALGWLSICRDNGPLTSAAYPDAAAMVKKMKELGGNVVSMDQYAADLAAQGGVCAKFALSDDGATFRIPCIPGMYIRGMGVSSGLQVGMWHDDAIRNITGDWVPSLGTSKSVLGAVRTDDAGATRVKGAFRYGEELPGTTFQNLYWSSAVPSSTVRSLAFDASGSVPTASENRTKAIVADYHIKMYGYVSEKSELNLAALVQAASSMLPRAEYEADAWGRPKAFAIVAENGSVISSKNVVTVSIPQTGFYEYTFPQGLFTSSNIIPLAIANGYPVSTRADSPFTQTKAILWVGISGVGSYKAKHCVFFWGE